MRSLKLAGLILLIATTCYGQTTKPPQRSSDLQIRAMRAMLFFETSGTFSPDVFTNEVNLWNTTIEGASRSGASESMLVVIEVQGSSAGWADTRQKVQLTARYRIADVSGYGKPAFFNKTMTISIGSDNKFFGGFWLYETGCHPVTLTARIVGQKRSLRKTINLGCGE